MVNSAWDDVSNRLRDGEAVEAIVFGEWGWGGYGEPSPPAVPKEKRGILLSPAVARPLMQSWSFCGGFGAPECYAAYIWTNHRVLWVTQYDGATGLNSAPRNPVAITPVMPGG